MRKARLPIILLALFALTFLFCTELGFDNSRGNSGNPHLDDDADDDSTPTVEECESGLEDAFDNCFANIPPPPPDECLVSATDDYIECLDETGEFSEDEIDCGQGCVDDAKRCLDDCADDPTECGPCVAQLEPCIESCGLPFPFDFGADDDDDDEPNTLEECVEELHEDIGRCCYSGEFYYACFVEAVYEYLDCIENTGELEQAAIDCGRDCTDVAHDCVEVCHDEEDIEMCEGCLSDLAACLLMCGIPLGI